jgi:hypothetical protein
VRIDFSRTGKPTDNAYVEWFNGTLRSECLGAHCFASLTEAKQTIEAWRREASKLLETHFWGDTEKGTAYLLLNWNLFITGAVNVLDLIVKPKDCKVTLRF